MRMQSTYLERYLAGECELVWAELQEHGESVRNEPLLSDALAVARETMRRVRQNLETLIPRMAAIGYQFGYGWIQPPNDKPFEWHLRREYSRMISEALAEPPILTVHSDVEEQLAEARGRFARLSELGAPDIIMENERRIIAELEAAPRASTWVSRLEEQFGLLPLSVRAWYEIVGGVNLVGTHPGWLRLISQSAETAPGDWELDLRLEWGGHPMQALEPLHVMPLSDRRMAFLHEALNLQSGAASGVYWLPVMENGPSAYLEQGQDSYSFDIEVPCSHMDALLHGAQETFVGHLRNSLRWAGFPGWEQVPMRPEGDIAALTEGLLTF